MTSIIKPASFGLALLLLGGLAALSVRGIVDPAGAAASFGVGVPTPEAELYHVVYRSRNLILALTGLAFLFAGLWRALAILATLSIALPAFDIWALASANTPIAAVHPATLGLLVLLAASLWLRVRLNP